MPPSPQEIKARLDKVVDQEGNVLDMGTVLDIVSVLEKISITKEALETTRIGRIINLLRKKTNNEELAKRAKKLVKKWQKLVSNHFKNLSSKAVDSPGNSSRTLTPTPQVNGVLKDSSCVLERPRSCNEVQKKIGVKRKRSSVSADGSPVDEKNNAQSIKPGNKQTDELQRKADLIQTHDKNVSICPNISANIKNGQHSNGNIVSCKESSGVRKVISPKLTNLNLLELDESKNGQGTDHVEESEWLEVQSNYLPTEEIADKLTPTSSHEPPSDIPEEQLSVKRKSIPDEHIDPTEEADGVNGCYDKDDMWCDWTQPVMQNDSNLNIHPYVTLA